MRSRWAEGATSTTSPARMTSSARFGERSRSGIAGRRADDLRAEGETGGEHAALCVDRETPLYRLVQACYADGPDRLERFARYLLRPPVSPERLRVDGHAQTIAYAVRSSADLQIHTAAAPIDPKESLARVVMHRPAPYRHVIRSHGAYSRAVRARHRRDASARDARQQAKTAPPPAAAPAHPQRPNPQNRKPTEKRKVRGSCQSPSLLGLPKLTPFW